MYSYILCTLDGFVKTHCFIHDFVLYSNINRTSHISHYIDDYTTRPLARLVRNWIRLMAKQVSTQTLRHPHRHNTHTLPAKHFNWVDQSQPPPRAPSLSFINRLARALAPLIISQPVVRATEPHRT